VDLFNVQIVPMLKEELDESLPLRLCTFEIYSSPSGMNGQLRA
jgi:hypothetical protein